MTVSTRFAPSPTGKLHVGNIRTALHNWLLARKAGGRFVLRIDDTDAERSREEYVEAIRADLAWLGLEPDGDERQSARLAHYEAAFERLRDDGRVYPCYETSQELELRRKVLLGRGLPPIYDRAALELGHLERAAKEAEGVAPHWRFKLDHGSPIEWDDLIRGHQRFDPATMSDPVIRRADGSWLYMLPSAIDDAEMGVTHVVRGEDHVSNTALQLQMFAAMGSAAPAFAPFPVEQGGRKEVRTDRDIGIIFANLLEHSRSSGPLDPTLQAIHREGLVGGIIQPAQNPGSPLDHLEVAVAIDFAERRRHQSQNVAIFDGDRSPRQAQCRLHSFSSAYMTRSHRSREDKNSHNASYDLRWRGAYTVLPAS